MAHTPTVYTYGVGKFARTYASSPYHPLVAKIEERLNKDGLRYNVCFLNRYDGRGQFLGWHADDSPGMDLDHPIAVISLGEAREIWWKPQGETGVVPVDQRQLLAEGSLFVMPAGFQRTHFHRIPKGDHDMGTRISLTFRHYEPAS
jgi:alkylated DNA repair dioxygenase AlkB